METDSHLSQGISALKASDRQTARRHLAQALRESLENARAEPVNAGDILEHLNAEIAKRDRLTEAYLAGAYQLDEYLRHKSPLDETIKRAEKQHRNIEDAIRRQIPSTRSHQVSAVCD